MDDPNQPIMVTFRCSTLRARAVRKVLEAYRPVGVRFEGKAPGWWTRLLTGRATFTIRCPAFALEQLRQQLDQEVLRKV